MEDTITDKYYTEDIEHDTHHQFLLLSQSFFTEEDNGGFKHEAHRVQL